MHNLCNKLTKLKVKIELGTCMSTPNNWNYEFQTDLNLFLDVGESSFLVRESSFSQSSVRQRDKAVRTASSTSAIFLDFQFFKWIENSDLLQQIYTGLLFFRAMSSQIQQLSV